MFYKHILREHVDQHNQGRNPPVSGLERREEDIWSESCALWPKRYSEMNLWVTLAPIFVYLTVHFKIDCDGCLSVDTYFLGHGGVFPHILFYRHFGFRFMQSRFVLVLLSDRKASLLCHFISFSCLNLCSLSSY